MMIADLVDQEDLREYLLQTGAPIPAGISAQEAVSITLAWLQTQPAGKRQQVDQLAQQLMLKPEYLLPAVKSALDVLLTQR